MCYNFHTQRRSFILLELVLRKGGTSPMKRRMLRQSSKYACSPHSKKSKPRLSKALLSLFVYTLSILSTTNTTPLATSSKTMTAFTKRNKVELPSILTLLSGASLGLSSNSILEHVFRVVNTKAAFAICIGGFLCDVNYILETLKIML